MLYRIAMMLSYTISRILRQMILDKYKHQRGYIYIISKMLHSRQKNYIQCFQYKVKQNEPPEIIDRATWKGNEG